MSGTIYQVLLLGSWAGYQRRPLLQWRDRTVSADDVVMLLLAYMAWKVMTARVRACG